MALGSAKKFPRGSPVMEPTSAPTFRGRRPRKARSHLPCPSSTTTSPSRRAPTEFWRTGWARTLPRAAPQATGGEKLPVGAVEVANDFGRGAWGGPCPPDRRHNYYFRVYALKVEKLGGVDLDDFHERAKAQSLAVAEVVASYERKK